MHSLDHKFKAARRAARKLARRDDTEVSRLLLDVADSVEAAVPEILEANACDLSRMRPDDPKYDRLMLTDSRLRAIAGDIRSVASLPSPLGRVLSAADRPNGLHIEKVSVPFGVIGVIYEARPNVTLDVFSLCVKAGSACVLKGGSDAADTNAVTVALLRRVLREHGWDEDIVTLLDGGHDATACMLNAVGLIDIIIPRGSKNLINYVRANARVPVIETGAGVCHTYIHSSADTAMARDIVYNAKTRRVSVCNALDCLVIDRSRLDDLADICAPLATRNVSIYADTDAYRALDGKYPLLHRAESDDFGREWLDYCLSVATVDGLDSAIDFINENTSHHSEAIIAADSEAQSRFMREIDAACVYANASTAFTDGGQFGFGAEIGISTQKLHARGPMGLPEITTYKYLITGNGQTRNP